MRQGTTLIKNAKVVNSKITFDADILIKDGKIDALLACGSNVAADKVIDAAGKYVMPGAVDGHTHMMDPGFTDRETFEQGTAAAAVGGITTVVDHHRTTPAVYSVGPLLDKIKYLEPKAVVDFGLKGGCSPDNQAELKAMWDEGITGFKTFTCNLHGVKAMYTVYLIKTMRTIKSFNGTLLIHCEDDGLCAEAEERLKAEGRTDFLSQYEWRNKLAEEVAVKTVIMLAKETGCRTVIAHVSQPKLLDEIAKAKEEGYEIYAESCPHYFYLTPEDLERLGPWAKFTPPMNTKENRDRLWEMFDGGYVDTIGSDHCPYPKAQKEPGLKNIWDAPNGIPGVETSLRLMLNGVSEGKTTLNRVVECMCENTATIYGLDHRKGFIRVGADADIVILDMDKEVTIRNEDIVSKCGWSPFNGKKTRGQPILVMVRGNVVAENGKVVGTPGTGEFVRRHK